MRNIYEWLILVLAGLAALYTAFATGHQLGYKCALADQKTLLGECEALPDTLITVEVVKAGEPLQVLENNPCYSKIVNTEELETRQSVIKPDKIYHTVRLTLVK